MTAIETLLLFALLSISSNEKGGLACACPPYLLVSPDAEARQNQAEHVPDGLQELSDDVVRHTESQAREQHACDE